MEEALLRAVLFGTPILLAGLGALLAERSGVVNLGVEGMMALAALTAFAAAQAYGPLPGVLAAFGVGALSGLFLGLFAVTLRANQFVAGLAVAALGLGASGLLGKRYEGLPLAHPLPEGGFALLGRPSPSSSTSSSPAPGRGFSCGALGRTPRRWTSSG